MFEILINKNGRNNEIALLENEKLIEFYIDNDSAVRKEGNIYIGIVKDIIKGMQAAFVDIGTEKNGFIHLKDLLPKVDEKKDSVLEEIDISDVVKKGQKILVQVKKDSNTQKGARVSTHINLPGKYVALMPNTDIVTVSQKIEDKKEQTRLMKLARETLSKENGAIIRTSALGKNDELKNDIKSLENKWGKIKSTFEKYKDNKPKLISKSENIVTKMIMDLPDNSISRITVNSKKEFEKIKSIKEECNYLDNTEIVLKEDDNIFSIYDVEKEIAKLEYRKIWLKCGGFITIDKTEALTAIDVNTGKYTGNKEVDKTIFKVNKEATVEIAKQLRLRDIGGIVIIDYIDMDNAEDKEKIKDLLESNLKNDRAKTQIEGFTKLNLMELTRKHICSHKE